MSRFRTIAKTASKTVNLAGGEAYKQDAKLELVSLLLTSFVSDKFYEKSSDQLARLTKLAESIPDKKFLAKAAIFARTEYGMRSITHALIGEIARVVKGEEWTKKAIARAVYRPDDMLEILAYYGEKYGKPFPNSLKKGLALAYNSFDGYQISKYRGDRSNVKMVDLLNLIHVAPKADLVKTTKDLMTGKLVNTERWETKLTQAGQKAESDEEKAEMKGAAWKSLILEKKLGYFALLRNLRNIEEQAPEVLPQALAMLKDTQLIKKSLVMPFRFNTAKDQVSRRETVEAISDALETSMANVPKFDGRTLIVLDESGSMSGKPIEIGSLFAAVLYKANPGADFMSFSTDARYRSFNSRDSVLSIAAQMSDKMIGGGTNFHAPFNAMNKPYDRIIFLSDMQGWVGHTAPTAVLAHYEVQFGVKPYIYSFDLSGYGSLQFPQQRVFAIAGFSEKVLDLFSALEKDKNALVKKIEDIEI